MPIIETAPTLIARLYGPDQPGLVAKTAQWIFSRGGNILHADQHHDHEAGVFFQRIEWQPGEQVSRSSEATAFTEFGQVLGMEVKVSSSEDRPAVAIFVSKIPHCFLDLLARWQQDEFSARLACVVSNHAHFADEAAHHGIPFYHVPVTAATKEKAEARQLDILREHDIDLVVMARYMQVLSGDFLASCACPVINIHHSFLPAFAGAKPYHQAYERGVKLIGATAHYATAVLDDGPIIQQDVAAVNHRHSVGDLVRKGRDLEKSVLAQALRWHLTGRVLVYGRKTVVFD